MNRRTILLGLVLFLLPFVVVATPAAWQIDSKKSAIHFSAIQNNSPIAGQFTLFTGEINFDPAELNTSHVNIVVDTNSVTTSYKEISDTLKTPDWFDVKLFPQAVFIADKFTKTGDKTYQAQGNLTIRDKTVPVTLQFTLEEYQSTKALIKGTTTLKRTAFGVGRGEWAKTDAVKDDVQVNFVLAVVRK